MSTIGAAMIATAPSTVKAEGIDVTMGDSAIVVESNGDTELDADNQVDEQSDSVLDDSDDAEDTAQNHGNDDENTVEETTYDETEDTAQNHGNDDENTVGETTYDETENICEENSYDDNKNDISDIDYNENVVTTTSVNQSTQTGMITDEYGNTKYIDENGYTVKDKEVEWNNKKYYFDYDGNLVKSERVHIPGSQTIEGNDKTVYATEDGSLAISSWITINGCKHYFDDDGNEETGLNDIEGNKYFFNDYGELKVSGDIVVDGVVYICDGSGVEGALTELNNNNWTKVNGKFYYVKDGNMLKHCVVEISGAYYGFDYDGAMYYDTTFGIRNGNDSKTIYYRAKENGSLYVNEWYYDDDNKYNNCFYGNEGKAADGITEINGLQYYFSQGYLCYNRKFEQNGKKFITSDDGEVYELKNNDWSKVGSDYYYLKDGKLLSDCVEKINGIYYGFNSSGIMYDDTSFYITIYDDKGNYAGDKSYRAKKGGALYVSEWYSAPYDTNPQYYGADATLANGVVELEGKLYLFSYGYKSEYRTASYEGKKYISDENGCLTEYSNDGWIKLDGKWHYIKDDVALLRCVESIDGKYYGFDDSGVMYSDGFFRINDKCYYANEDGSLVTSNWMRVPNYGGWFYFGADGAGVSGLVTLDGVQYYFANGCLQVNCAFSENGKNYICNNDGTVITANEGWNNVDGNYYYVADGNFYRNCVRKIGDSYFGFGYDGIMYDNCQFSIYDENESRNIYYHAQIGGYLYTNSWVENGNDYEYYGDDAACYDGIREVNGVSYYFCSGIMARNTAYKDKESGKKYICDDKGNMVDVSDKNGWTTQDGKWYYATDDDFYMNCIKKIGDKLYGFNDNGVMYSGTRFEMNIKNNDGYFDNGYFYANEAGDLLQEQWKMHSDSWYYYGDDGCAYHNGIHKIGSNSYYFDYRGQMMTECAISNFICDKNGIVHNESGENRWIKYDDIYYYLQDGNFITNNICKIDNVYYAFDSDGHMQNNGLGQVYIPSEFMGKYVYCYANKDGSLLTNAWIKLYENWYYFDNNAIGVDGLQTINGTDYCFENGRMITNRGLIIGDNNYICDNDGNVIEANENNRWYHVDKYYYYVKNGNFLKSCVEKINDKYYIFNDSGIMLDSTDFVIYNQDGSYRIKSDGSLYVKQWYWDTDGDLYYYGSDAKGAEGITTIDGKKYYFSSGRLERNTAIAVDGVNYVADRNGDITTLKSDGWTYINGYYYYTSNNVMLKDTIVQIGNAYYGFDSNGCMYADTIFWMDYRDSNGYWQRIWYSADESGALKTNCWDEDSGDRYFFDADGRGYDGIKTINGIKYYFGGGRLVTDGLIDNKYISSSDGTLTELTNNSWTNIDGKWYYMQNNEILGNCVANIDNVNYLFKSDGQLASDEIVYVNMDSSYIADSSGRLLINSWYQDSDGDYKYVGADGDAYTGLQTINGKQYIFNERGWMQYGVVSYNGKLYVADASGAVSEISSNGWIETSIGWYYVKDNGLYSNGVYQIGNNYYAFDYNGKMYDNEVLYLSTDLDPNIINCYFATSGGALLFNSSVVYNGETYYFDAEGVGYKGIHSVNGENYYFMNGALCNNYAICVDGDYYVVDSNLNKIALNNNAWTKIEGKYYYVKDGIILRNGIYKVNGSYYAFDDCGRMYEDTLGFLYDDENEGADFHATASGALTIGWYYESNTWYYFGKDGQAYNGVHYIDGIKYNFSNGMLL